MPFQDVDHGQNLHADKNEPKRERFSHVAPCLEIFVVIKSESAKAVKPDADSGNRYDGSQKVGDYQWRIKPETNERGHEHDRGAQLCGLDRVGRANGRGLVNATSLLNSAYCGSISSWQ
jgi:hypothetical protein